MGLADVFPMNYNHMFVIVSRSGHNPVHEHNRSGAKYVPDRRTRTREREAENKYIVTIKLTHSFFEPSS